MKFSILNSELKAAMLFASDDESRFVLNGVHVEVTAGKQPILVATNGRALCVIQSEAVQDPTSGPSATFILSASFLRKICPFSKSKLFPFITFEPHPPKRMFCTTMDPKCFIDCEEGALIEGDYPNWRQTLPCGEKEQVKNVGFSGEFLSDFTKAAIALGANPFLRP